MENKYIENAKVIQIAELPAIGKRWDLHPNCVCVELEMEKYKDGYIIYNAWYCPDFSLEFLDELYMDCVRYKYAVKRTEFLENLSNNKG